MENQKLLTAEATQEQEKFIQPTFDDIAKEAAGEVRDRHGLSEGQIVEGYGAEGQVGYVDTIDPTTGKARVKIMSREAAEARALKTVEEASEINEPRDERLKAFDEVAAMRRRKFGQRVTAVAAGAAAFIGMGILPPAGESATPRAVAQEQTIDDPGITPFKNEEAKAAATWGTPEHTEAMKADYEKALAKQYAEDDNLSTFASENKISEKAFGESPLVEGDAFATWEKGMDQLNHNSAAQAHVIWNLPGTLKQELNIDGQRVSDLSTDQLQTIFDTNLRARDTLIGEVTDMLENGDVSLEMVTRNTAYSSYHIEVDENGKKHIVETPYLPQAERHVLIMGYKGETKDSNVECDLQGRSDIAPERVATAVAAATVTSQAPSQSENPTTPNTPNTPDKPNEPKTPEPENPEPEKPGKDPLLDPETQGNNKPGHGGIEPPVTGPATPPEVEIGEGGSEDPTNIPEIIAPGADDTTAEEVIEDAVEAGNPVEDINGNPVTPGTNNGRPSDGTVNQ